VKDIWGSLSACVCVCASVWDHVIMCFLLLFIYFSKLITCSMCPSFGNRSEYALTVGLALYLMPENTLPLTSSVYCRVVTRLRSNTYWPIHSFCATEPFLLQTFNTTSASHAVELGDTFPHPQSSSPEIKDRRGGGRCLVAMWPGLQARERDARL